MEVDCPTTVRINVHHDQFEELVSLALVVNQAQGKGFTYLGDYGFSVEVTLAYLFVRSNNNCVIYMKVPLAC